MRTFDEIQLPENPNAWQTKVEELRRLHRLSLTTLQDATSTKRATIYYYLKKTNDAPTAKFYTKAFNKKLAATLKTSPEELWSVWQASSMNSRCAKTSTEGLRAFIAHYPANEIPKDLLVKLLG